MSPRTNQWNCGFLQSYPNRTVQHFVSLVSPNSSSISVTPKLITASLRFATYVECCKDFTIRIYWGQTPVFLVRTFREHHQEMHNLLRMSQPRTLQENSEFTSQFTDNILSGTHAQYIQDVPGHITAVFWLGKLWENSGFTEQCSCSVPKWLIERTLPVHCKFPDYVMAMYPLGKPWENLKISQRSYSSFSLLGHWECTDDVPDMWPKCSCWENLGHITGTSWENWKTRNIAGTSWMFRVFQFSRNVPVMWPKFSQQEHFGHISGTLSVHSQCPNSENDG